MKREYPRHKISTEALVALAQLGNKPALETLCVRFCALLHKASRQNYLRTMEEDAYQTVSESFLKAVRDYDFSRGTPFEGYVKRKVYGDLLTWFRSVRRRWDREVTPSATESGEDFFDLVEGDASPEASVVLRESLRQAIAVLTERERRILQLLYVEGRTLKEVSAAVALSVKGVFSARTRILKKLRNVMEAGERACLSAAPGQAAAPAPV
ncbi:RNA polymerase sporulation sigma factor SigH [Selenomonas sp. TAMA-11512]|uniref:RNA polymerase sigma factor n=1 Tax=Selenomonas sp. TAMA-11512 TaxID=3095337 RepID=UPI003085349F|nr:RNA polymerase sporulation sigma factor SigH [Selenomonas sp. TAMA-11512]